jgi:hypothetical protein
MVEVGIAVFLACSGAAGALLVTNEDRNPFTTVLTLMAFVGMAFGISVAISNEPEPTNLELLTTEIRQQIDSIDRNLRLLEEGLEKTCGQDRQ